MVAPHCACEDSNGNPTCCTRNHDTHSTKTVTMIHVMHRQRWQPHAVHAKTMTVTRCTTPTTTTHTVRRLRQWPHVAHAKTMMAAPHRTHKDCDSSPHALHPPPQHTGCEDGDHNTCTTSTSATRTHAVQQSMFALPGLCFRALQVLTFSAAAASVWFT